MKVSPSSIQRLYKKNNIRFKLIQRIKKVINFDEPQYKAWFNSTVDDLTKAKEQEIHVVFLYEAVFTFNTFKAKV